MDTALLKTVVQIAGIGGVALGVLLLVFRDVIRRNIFPELGQAQAYRLIRLVVILTFSISVVGISAWVYTHMHETPPQGVTQWRKNWETISEQVPRTGSSGGYSATNRERTLGILKALDLASAPALLKERDELLALVERAQARPEDSTYNMRIPDDFDAKFHALKRGIRERAIAAGVTIAH